MKKLEKLTLLNEIEISFEEQKSIKGGADLPGITSFSGDGKYMDVSSWYSESQPSSGGTLSTLITDATNLPGAIVGSFFESAYHSITQALLDKGYSGSSLIYVDVNAYGSGGFYHILIYDAVNGSKIKKI